MKYLPCRPTAARAALFVALAGSTAWSTPDETVVLVNANVQASADLAAYYAERRHIPADHILALDLPVTELTTREDYNARLRDPLLAWLRGKGLIEQSLRSPSGGDGMNESGWETTACRLKYVVSTYGVPLRIAGTQDILSRLLRSRLAPDDDLQDRAAVDSELAMVLQSSYPIRGLIQNPLYGRRLWPDAGAAEYKNTLIAARLDGPDLQMIRQQIDAMLEHERYGILGRAYFDARGLSEGGHVLGDLWIEEAYERFLREGYECLIDREVEVFPADYPMEAVGVYLGWYEQHVTGPFLRDGFRFEPGALAYHLHSGSAETLRSPSRHWAGPLLSSGAAITMGAVFEPYLSFTPQLDVFCDRLCSGNSFGESAYSSMTALSWQITVVGDPLYRPFMYSLEEQVAHLEADGHPGVDWGYLRVMNRMIREGRHGPALDYCLEKIRQTESLVLRERLGDAYILNRMEEQGIDTYRQVLQRSDTAATQIRVGAKCALAYDRQGRTDEALDLLQDLRDRWVDDPSAPWLDTARERIAP